MGKQLGSESFFFKKNDSDPNCSGSDANFSTPIFELLESVKDPEIPVLSIRDLGILRAVEFDGARVRVAITPTYSGCPAMHMIEQEVRAVLQAEVIKVIRLVLVTKPSEILKVVKCLCKCDCQKLDSKIRQGLNLK